MDIVYMNQFIKKNIKNSNGIFINKKDPNIYKSVHLSNGIEILFVSNGDDNRKINTSSACMTVDVGYIDDYTDKLGIAHFLEHLLFMGSSKYPKSNEYFEFIHSNGGTSNAHTARNHTWYYFDVNSESFLEGLDIFSYFFIDPLLREENVEKEVNAVNSEHLKNIYNPHWRKGEMFKKFFNQNNNISNFSTGSLETLLSDGKEILAQKVREFFSEKYSSEKMKLYIYHTDISDQFVQKVSDMFEAITKKTEIHVRNKNVPVMDPSQEDDTIYMIETEGYDEGHSVDIQWMMKGDNDRTGSKLVKNDITLDILASITGHEGDGSLYDFLKNNELVTGLFSGPSRSLDSDYVFTISISLTDKGLQQIDSVISHVMGFLRFIQKDINTNSAYYKKYIKGVLIKNKINFKDYLDTDPMDHLQYCATLHDEYKIETNFMLINKVMISDDIDFHFNNFKHTVQKIKINQAQILKTSKDIHIKNPKTEKHYGIKYDVKMIPSMHYLKHKYVKSYLPKISDQLDSFMLEMKVNNSKKDYIHRYDSDHDVYIDTKNPFNVDTINITIRIDLPHVMKKRDPIDVISLIMYISYIKLLHNKNIYDLAYGLCNISFGTNGTSVRINIDTYESNIVETLQMCIDWIKNTDKLNVKMLRMIAQNMETNFKNFEKSEPYIKVNESIMESILKKYTCTTQMLLKTVRNIDYDSVETIARDILRKGVIRSVVSGNVTFSTGQRLASMIDSIVSYSDELNGIENYSHIENVSHVKENTNKDDSNSVSVTLYMMDNIKYGENDWDLNTCYISLLESVIKTVYFHELRTVKQLGYIAKTKKINLNLRGPVNKKSVYLCVQSSKMDSKSLHAESVNVIKTYVKEKIDKMDHKKFMVLKSGLKSILSMDCLNIYSRVNNMMLCMEYYKNSDKSLCLTFSEHLSKALDKITLSSLKSYFYEKFINNPTIYHIGITTQKH
jgi:insulysin